MSASSREKNSSNKLVYGYRLDPKLLFGPPGINASTDSLNWTTEVNF